MNGVLMTEGIDAISIPAIRATEFNSRMVDFYMSRDATEMMAFVLDCHPEVSQIRRLNPGLSVVKDLPDIEYFSLSDSIQQRNYETDSTGRVDRAAATDLEPVPMSKQPTRIYSIDETRRAARESWRRKYYDKRASQLEPQKDSRQDAEKNQPQRDAGVDFDPEN
jgi:hypothetical protein